MASFILGIFLGLIIFLILTTHVYGGILAAPWVPMRKKDLGRIIKLADIKPGDKIYDLGSGDGRVVLALSKKYPEAQIIGFEIAALPYIISKVKILLFKLKNRNHNIKYKTNIYYKNFLKEKLSNAKVIICFLTPKAMCKLKEKFLKELKAGTKILSYAFKIPGFKGIKDKPKEKDVPIYIYQI